MPEPALVYDELTERRIEAAATRRRAHAGTGRRRPAAGRGRVALGSGALLTAVALGVREVLGPQDAEAIVEEVTPDEPDGLPAVELLLVPGAPRLSRAIVRPWLLGLPGR